MLRFMGSQRVGHDERLNCTEVHWDFPGGSLRASLVVQLAKNLPAMQETWVQSVGWEDPLEKEMETHSSILAWRIPRT